MGDGSMTTLTIADPEKEGIGDYLKSLPSRYSKVFFVSLQSNNLLGILRVCHKGLSLE